MYAPRSWGSSQRQWHWRAWCPWPLSTWPVSRWRMWCVQQKWYAEMGREKTARWMEALWSGTLLDSAFQWFGGNWPIFPCSWWALSWFSLLLSPTHLSCFFHPLFSKWQQQWYILSLNYTDILINLFLVWPSDTSPDAAKFQFLQNQIVKSILGG